MKVGIIGSYGGGSIGDEAILKGLLTVINESSIKIDEVVVYSSNKDQTLYALSPMTYNFALNIFNWNTKKVPNYESNTLNPQKSYLKKSLIKTRKKATNLSPSMTLILEKSVRQILNKPLYKFDFQENLDVLLFGGGNILMDLYPQWALFLESALIECKKKNIEPIFLGVGAGPVETKKGKRVISDIAKNFYTSTRDEESVQLLEKMVVERKNLSTNTDLAFGLAKRNYKKHKEGIGITAVPYYAEYYWPVTDKIKYQNYCVNMSRVLDLFIKTTKEPVTFFATNYPADVIVAKNIVSIMEQKSQVKIDETKMNVDGILEFCSNKKFIVGTRLHSLILSSCAMTNFYAINYQPKVNNFLNRIDKKNDFIDIKKLENNMSDREIEIIVTNLCTVYYNDEMPNFAYKEKEKLINEIEYLFKG